MNACFRLIIVFLCTTNNARHDYRVFLSMTCSLFCSIRLQRNAAPMCSPTHKHTESERAQERQRSTRIHVCVYMSIQMLRLCGGGSGAAAMGPPTLPVWRASFAVSVALFLLLLLLCLPKLPASFSMLPCFQLSFTDQGN